MADRRPRSELIPNANNPRLLLRLVGYIATGIRRASPLAEVLEVELRTIHYYTQAAEWLGLIEPAPGLRLTARGLALAYGSPDAQHQLYAQAVWSNPLAAALLGGRDRMPTIGEIADVILARAPTLSASTARRRASAVRSLLAPAFDHKPSARSARGAQLGLPFPPPPPPSSPEPVDTRAGESESPDIYRRLLLALLDNGELATGQVRALLDDMGARGAPLGPYMDMATRRGDATRLDNRLVVTHGACHRRDMADDAALVAFTDPLYRDYLIGLDAIPDALERIAAGRATTQDARLRARLSQLAQRFRAWDQRLFGHSLKPGQAAVAADSLLLGRRLSGMPVAGSSAAPGQPADRESADGSGAASGAGAGVDRDGLLSSYLEQTPGSPVLVAFPRSLSLLAGGVASINPRLRAERAAPAAVRLPSPLDCRVMVHGGLLSPGETAPRAVPDNVSLRLRAITHVPAISLMTALLLAGRRGGRRQPVLRVGQQVDAPIVSFRDHSETAPLALFTDYCASIGQITVRPPCDGLTDTALASLCEDLGIATRAAGRLLLDEVLFTRLQEDPECRLVYEALLPVEDRLMSWVEGI